MIAAKRVSPEISREVLFLQEHAKCLDRSPIPRVKAHAATLREKALNTDLSVLSEILPVYFNPQNSNALKKLFSQVCLHLYGLDLADSAQAQEALQLLPEITNRMLSWIRIFYANSHSEISATGRFATSCLKNSTPSYNRRFRLLG